MTRNPLSPFLLLHLNRRRSSSKRKISNNRCINKVSSNSKLKLNSTFHREEVGTIVTLTLLNINNTCYTSNNSSSMLNNSK